MPYLKRIGEHEKSKRLLKGYEINAVKLAAYIGVSEPTARKRLNNPGLLTGNDWLNISRKGHIPIEEIRNVFLS